jgi:hypothetical protein
MPAIIRSKNEFRRQLATRSIEEKLTLLDSMRERSVSLRNATAANTAAAPTASSSATSSV